MVKIKDIDGVQISKRTSIGPMGDDERDMLVYNDAIEEQGSVGIGLNRERLAAFLYTRKIKNYRVPTAEDILEVTAESYYEADAIIANENELIEVKK